MRSPSASVAAAGHVLPYEGSELWQEVYQSYYVFTVSRWERGRALPDPKAAAKLARLAEIVEIIGEAIRPEDVATFLMTPHPELRGHAPGELLENAFGFEAAKDLVLAAQSGAYR